MKIKQLLLVTILTVFSNLIYAIQDSNPTELAQEYMAFIASDGLEKATFKYIGKTESLEITDKKQRIRHQKIIQNLRDFGGIIGYEIISKENIGSSVEVHRYILKTDRYPMLGSVYLYKPKDKWIIFNMQISNIVSNNKNNSGAPLFSWFSIF